MQMDHIRQGNGFVCKKRFLDKMCRMRPPTGDYYRLKKTPKSSFATVGVMAYGAALMPLFKIYAGNKELYDYIEEVFLNTCSSLGFEGKTDKWRESYDVIG